MGRRPRKLLIDEGLPGCIRERLHDDGYTLILAQELGKGLSDEELLAYAAQEKDIDMNTELLVMASNDGTIQAFDAETGSSRWQWRSNHPFGGPALARVGDAVIAMSLDGSLVALDFADGSVRWESLLPESVPLGSPMYGLRVVANEDRLVVQQGACYFGVDTNDGHVHWISGSPRAVQGPWLLAVGQKHAYLAQLDAPFPKPPSTPAPERTDPTHSPHAWTPPSS